MTDETDRMNHARRRPMPTSTHSLMTSPPPDDDNNETIKGRRCGRPLLGSGTAEVVPVRWTRNFEQPSKIGLTLMAPTAARSSDMPRAHPDVDVDVDVD